MEKVSDGFHQYYYESFPCEKNVIKPFMKPMSFIIKGKCEICEFKWNHLYRRIVNKLQQLYPIEEKYLICKASNVTNDTMFSLKGDSTRMSTNFGLYVKNYANANYIVPAINRLLEIYGIKEECFLIFRHYDIAFKEDEENIIYNNRVRFEEFVKEYIKDGDKLLPKFINAIDVLDNFLLKDRFNNNKSIFSVSYIANFDLVTNDLLKQYRKSENHKYPLAFMYTTIALARSALFIGSNIDSNELEMNKHFTFTHNEEEITIYFKDIDY